MSKAAKVTVWSVIAIILTAILLVLLFGSGHKSFYNVGSVSGYYKDSNLYKEGNVKSDAQSVKNIEIHWICGDVKIIPHSGSQIEISESINDGNDELNSKNSMRYLIKDGKLTVQFTKSYKFFERLFYNVRGKSLTVLIPQNNLNLDEFSVNTVSADSIVKSFNGQNLTVNNVSGNIELTDCNLTDKLSLDNVSGTVNIKTVKADSLKLGTVSGNITLTDTEAEKLDIDTVSGKIKADGSFKEIDGESVSGDYTVTSATALNKISFDSVSGCFDLLMPENSGFTADFDGVSGDFNSNFPIISSNGKKVFGNGSAPYDFDVVSGDVTINRIGGQTAN